MWKCLPAHPRGSGTRRWHNKVVPYYVRGIRLGPLDKMAMTWNRSWAPPHEVDQDRPRDYRPTSPSRVTSIPFTLEGRLALRTQTLTAFVNGGSLTGVDPVSLCMRCSSLAVLLVHLEGNVFFSLSFLFLYSVLYYCYIVQQ